MYSDKAFKNDNQALSYHLFHISIYSTRTKYDCRVHTLQQRMVWRRWWWIRSILLIYCQGQFSLISHDINVLQKKISFSGRNYELPVLQNDIEWFRHNINFYYSCKYVILPILLTYCSIKLFYLQHSTDLIARRRSIVTTHYRSLLLVASIKWITLKFITSTKKTWSQPCLILKPLFSLRYRKH